MSRGDGERSNGNAEQGVARVALPTEVDGRRYRVGELAVEDAVEFERVRRRQQRAIEPGISKRKDGGALDDVAVAFEDLRIFVVLPPDRQPTRLADIDERCLCLTFAASARC